jgi:hypothetical protein
VAGGAQGVGDMGADEAGPSGDEHKHYASVRPPLVIGRGARLVFSES